MFSLIAARYELKVVPRKGLEPSRGVSEVADNEEDKFSDFPIGTEKWTDILVLYPELREIVRKME